MLFWGIRVMGLVSKQHCIVGTAPKDIRHFLVYPALSDLR